MNPAPSATAASTACTSDDIARVNDVLIRFLVRDRVRRGQIPASDADDAVQHLHEALIRALPRFDPEQGAWSTFARSIARSELQKWLRHRLRECRNEHRAVSMHDDDGASLQLWASQIPDARAAEAFSTADRRAAVAEALALLTTDDRHVAQLLMSDHASQVQRQLGWCKRRLYQSIERIRFALFVVSAET